MQSERPPVAAAVAVLAAGGVWGSALLLGGDALVGLGTWLLTLVTLTGLLVARARWAVRVSLLVSAIAIPGVVVVESTWLSAIGVGASLVATWLVLSPGTAALVRSFRAADSPPDDAVVLMLLLVGAPTALGLAAIGTDPTAATWVVAGAAPVVGWWFGQRSAASLWVCRLVVPLALLAVGALEGWPHGLAAVGLAGAIGWYAWRPEVRVAAIPLAPTKVDGKPIFAEFAPREVRDAAGVDERGRRR
jgi:hypothetical protein